MTSIFFGRRLRSKIPARIFGTWAVLILCMVFFAVPFGMRGARLAVQDIRNDIKDWLPADFPETRDLTWFGKHFLSEKFVVVTFQGCYEGDERYKLLHKKLIAEIRERDVDELADKSLTPKQKERIRARIRGDELGLFTANGDFAKNYNWGGQNEKWLQGNDDSWYYIVPSGELYRWNGDSHVLGLATRGTERLLKGKVVHGKKEDHFGATTPKGEPNEFYQDPRRITARYLSSVTSGPEVMKILTAEDGPLSPKGNYSDDEKKAKARKDALDRLIGNLFGPKGKLTCIVVTLSRHGEEHFDRVVGRGLLGKPLGKIQQLAKDCGIHLPPAPSMMPFAKQVEGHEPLLRMGGPPVDNVSIDEEGTITLVRLIGFSVGLGVILSYICFRQVIITCMVFMVGGVSAITSMALVFYTGGSVDAVLLSMPSLVYVLGLSGAVHIVNYYRDAVEEGGEEGAAERALAHGWMPCTLAAVTTGIGLMSLRTSNIVPISKFGTYSAIGVIATLAILFTYLPAALEIFRPSRRPEDDDTDNNESEVEARKESILLTYFWDPIGRWIVRHYAIVGIACLLIMIACGLGLPKIKTEVQLLKLFDGDAQIIKDYRWLESNLGKLVPMELIVRVSPSMIGPTFKQLTDQTAPTAKPGVFPLSLLERAELVSKIQYAVETEFGDKGRGILGKGASATTFMPKLPRPGGSGRQRTYRNTFSKQVEDGYDQLLSLDYLSIDDHEQHNGSELWRISLRLAALQDVDYGEFVNQLKLVIEPVLEAYRCRVQVLTELKKEFKGGYRRSQILIVGADNPRRRKNPADTAKTAQNKTITEKQTKLFATTLDGLLRNLGFDYRRKPAYLSQERVEKADFAKLVKRGVNCVVLVGHVSDEKLTRIRQLVPVVIDSRKHRVTKETATTPREQPIHVVYTGVVPVVYKAQRTLLVSLIDSIKWAFLLIGLVMVVLLNPGRSFVDGLHPVNVTKGFLSGMVAMIPNLYPVIVIFGLMCHLGIAIDIGSMMTASVAMGVAVDDTIHFLSWFRKSIQQGMSRTAAIIETYRRVGPAMTQTTLIGGLGLSVFALSTFTPTQRFGTLMLTLLAAALLGDLVFLPALLASPLGRLFMPRTGGEEDERRTPRDGQPGKPNESSDPKAHNAPHTKQASSRRRMGNRQLRRDSGHT